MGDYLNRVVVEADGASRGNPGRAAFGALVLNEEETEVLAVVGEAIGEETNNVAEYHGLIGGLAAARDVGADSVIVRMDSKLVIEQMRGRWRVRHADIVPLAARARKRLDEFESVDLQWVRRESNYRADGLANAALDGKPLVLPPDALSPVTTRYVPPTVAKLPTREIRRTDMPNAVRLERTASVAVEVGGPPVCQMGAGDVAQLLITSAPDELADLWGRLPGRGWLAEKIQSSPLTWRRALADAMNQAASDAA
jgi:ribonuclease HI